MPQCCAFGCFTKPEKGSKLFLLPTGPRNEERRKIWIQKINRKNWNPSNDARLCEAHFTSDQFELNRVDGIRKLKPFAIPTVFSHRPMKEGRKPPAKRSTIAEITMKKRRKQHSGISCDEFPLPMQDFPYEDPENAEGADDSDFDGKVVEVTRKLDLTRKELRKMENKYEMLKKSIQSDKASFTGERIQCKNKNRKFCKMWE